MYILTEELEIENTCLLIDAALIEAEQAVTDRSPAPVIHLYSTVQPAPAAAIEANQSAIQASLNELATIMSNGAINPYKRKYEKASDILQYLATTSTRKEMATLYYVNADLIQQTSELQEAFINRKAVFYPYQPAVA